ncbi:acyltransferase family protein [Arthrobacter sp. TMS2-4]
MAVVEASRSVAPRGRGGGSDRGFRPEVQGLRALAVLMVVSYHIWFGRVSGGVDIFLLISAFLLSLSFLRRIEGGKPLDLVRHWLHQFKRLLPAVVVVIVGVLGASYVLVPQSRWPDIIEQSWASLFYVQNWVLASNAVDYYADDHSLASPLQHFWSLSVQGQVFILWPLLFLASALLARRFRLKVRGAVLLVFGVVFIASLAFSVWETYTNQAYAYFDTRARLWEFALGTLLALALPFLRLPRAVRILAGWVGVVAMLSGGFILDVQGQFPGYVALWPLLAAALVIVAGQTGSAVGADRFLSAKPLVRVGDLSYALYLWHWPVLVLALIWRDRPSPGVLGGFIIIAVSLVLAYLTMRFVERPMRALAWADKRRRRAVIVLAVCVGLVAAPLALWQDNLRQKSLQLMAQTDVNNPGATVMLPGWTGSIPAGSRPIPDPTALNREWTNFEERCSGTAPAANYPELRDRCSTTASNAPGAKHVMVVGDSHAEQWISALGPMLVERDYKGTSLLLGECTFGTEDASRADVCNRFNDQALDLIQQVKPDVVFTIGTKAKSGSAQDEVVPGLAEAANILAHDGVSVVAIRDTPRMGFAVTECLETHGDTAEECIAARADVLQVESPLPLLRQEAPSVGLMDLTDLFCTIDQCKGIIGNIYVYIDDNHMTRSYGSSTLPEFSRQFEAAAGW